MTPIVLFGAGGHAKMLVEILRHSETPVAGYCDRRKADWLTDIPQVDEDTVSAGTGRAVVGFAGVTPVALRDRVAFADRLSARGFEIAAIVHERSIVSDTAELGDGCQVLAGAVVQPNARIGRLAIINTGAIVEHDAFVGDGAHVAPGAVVLGGARVGACAIVGAGAVVLPGARVADDSLVPATTRYSS